MMKLDSHITAIIELCEKHKVSSLYVFGSVLTNNFTSNSDIDFIVDFKQMPIEEYIDNYFDFKFALEENLKRPVDLLENKMISNPYFKQNVDRQKQLVYG